MSVSSFRSSIKSAAAHGFHISGLTRATTSLLSVKGVILTFHEIHDDPSTELWTGCRTELFRACISWLRGTGWALVSLAEAVERLKRKDQQQKFAVITFDDGYRDNLSRALPVLQSEQAPFTVYVPTAAITRDLFAWWLGLRELFRTKERVDIAAMNTAFSCGDQASKLEGLRAATRWVHQNFRRISDLRQTFSDYGISMQGLCERYFINDGQLSMLAREPLASVGGHTVTHPALAVIDAQTARYEIADNRTYLQTCLDMEVNHLAFPFGSSQACGSREAKLAAEAGFQTAVTMADRPLFAHDDDLFTLPRIGVRPEWTLADIDAAMSGLTRATLSRLFEGRFTERSALASRGRISADVEAGAPERVIAS